ncbi:hypothetical protein AeRB84_019710, partial [Aphanomyces euteiches]
MRREESTEDGSTEVDQGRSRSRDRDEQPRGRQDRREVRNPFSGYVFTPATYGESSPGPAAAPVEPAAAPTEGVPASREAHETPLPEDTDMGSDAGYGRAQVWHAPAIPHPPTFERSTKAERRQFMREYQRYLSQINALHSEGSRPFTMPVSACMNPSSKRRIALFDFNKDHHEVTEDEWIAWFNAATEEEPLDLDVLKRRLTSVVRFDTKIIDAESRIGRMLDELMRALEQDHQEWVLTQEGKVVVDVMAKAIKPDALRIAVQKQLRLQKNKALKSDVFRFVNWLRQYAAGFQMYVGLDETPTPAAAPKGEAQRAGRGGGGSRGDGRAKPDAGAKGEGKGGAAAKPAAEKSKEDAKPKKKLACLKCGDASHRVADCPKAAPGEAQKLLDAQLKKWREAVQVLGDIPEQRRTDRGAMVEALVRVDNVLLDTGADVNVVSRGVMDALAAKGASVAVATHDKPRQIYP